MVKEILKIRHQLSADGADALAIALCHANMQGPLSGLSRQLQQMKVVKR
jgi:Holliday junction resolvasome RuvABC endonuclease subunit